MTKQPSPAQKQAVRDAFDADALAHTCETDDFSGHADYYPLPPQEGAYRRSEAPRFYWHADHGPSSRILAVGHLDTVQEDRSCRVTDTAAGLLATSGGLDDRLGVYTILHLLPALGIQTDVLLTTDEEIGQTTAFDFETDKQYDWIIEFDRGGTDVVCYQFTDDDLTQRVRAAGARPGEGIYSDICELEHLSAKALNWGIGYQDYHSPRAHAWLEDTFRQVARFQRFYRQNHGTYLPHTPTHHPYEDTLDAVADCGDLYDPDDPTTFRYTEGHYILCARCAEGRY